MQYFPYLFWRWVSSELNHKSGRVLKLSFTCVWVLTLSLEILFYFDFFFRILPFSSRTFGQTCLWFLDSFAILNRNQCSLKMLQNWFHLWIYSLSFISKRGQLWWAKCFKTHEKVQNEIENTGKRFFEQWVKGLYWKTMWTMKLEVLPHI